MSSGNRKYELKARADKQADTRRRIVEATVALHEEVGPARTTVAEIARRAGVQRLTVYKHFPEEQHLFAACQQRFLADHGSPDYGPALANTDPVRRVEKVLGLLYASYREREPMTSKVLRDRSLLPALDELMGKTMDASMAQLRDALAAPFGVRGKRAQRLRAVVAVALDFWTWRRLKEDGLDDNAAAALMADVVACVSSAS
jgi:AcrR family transcriptional regulator